MQIHKAIRHELQNHADLQCQRRKQGPLRLVHSLEVSGITIAIVILVNRGGGWGVVEGLPNAHSGLMGVLISFPKDSK